MEKNNCHNELLKNKYFVRDIYFILGIIHDFQFAIEFRTPNQPPPLCIRAATRRQDQ